MVDSREDSRIDSREDSRGIFEYMCSTDSIQEAYSNTCDPRILNRIQEVYSNKGDP